MKNHLSLNLPKRSLVQKRLSSSILRPFLSLASGLYFLGIKLWSLQWVFRRPAALPGLVVSIGNLTVGGTGKTPAVIMLARWALQAGYRVAVLSRGYGGQYHEKILEVTDGTIIKSDSSKAGDEPCLMAEKLKGVPIVLSKERFRAGQWAREHYGTDFFILDDGFQHRALKRDLDLVLLDAVAPFSNGHLLPWGLLREPIRHLKRAQAFLITRYDQKYLNDELETFLKSVFPAKPFFKSIHLPEQVVFSGGGASYSPEYLQDKHVAAFAGIANPEAFKATLLQLGAEIIFFRIFKDHHPYRMDEIHDLAAKARENKADFVITTEKDWMRIKALGEPFPELAYLSVQFRILAEEQLFFDILKNKAKEVIGH
jgi:tetraacyldisaccharide 4'-kinase